MEQPVLATYDTQSMGDGRGPQPHVRLSVRILATAGAVKGVASDFVVWLLQADGLARGTSDMDSSLDVAGPPAPEVHRGTDQERV